MCLNVGFRNVRKERVRPYNFNQKCVFMQGALTNSIV